MLPKLKLLDLWAKTPLKSFASSSFAINLALILIIVLLKGFLPPEVPLFYGKPVGEMQLTSALGLLIAPVASILITLINISLNFWVKDLFAKKILIISAFFVSVLTAITVLKIIFLVGFF